MVLSVPQSFELIEKKAQVCKKGAFILFLRSCIHTVAKLQASYFLCEAVAKAAHDLWVSYTGMQTAWRFLCAKQPRSCVLNR